MKLTKNDLCSNCGNVLLYTKKAYRLCNDDFVCSMKCAREYAYNYFELYDLKNIKENKK